MTASRLRTARRLALLATAGLAAATLPLSAGRAATTQSWQDDPGPATAGDELLAVSAGPSHTWAVGLHSDSNDPDATTHAIVESRSAGAWDYVDPPPGADALTSITQHDSTVWVGGTRDRRYDATRVWRYDGSWSALSTRGIPYGFRGKVFAAGSRLWLAGQVDPGLATSGAVLAAYHPGAAPRWKTERVSRAGGFLGAAALNGHDAWAVGGTRNTFSGHDIGHPLLAHWNGKRWTTTTLAPHAFLIAVAMSSHRDALAIGWRVNPKVLDTDLPPYVVENPVAFRWNGKHWRKLRGQCPCRGPGLSAGPHHTYWSTSLRDYTHLTASGWKHASMVAGASPGGASVSAIARLWGSTQMIAVGPNAGPGTADADTVAVHQSTVTP